MGLYRPRLEMAASLSRNNSRSDQIDNLLYEELVERIRRITAEPRYDHLHIDIQCDGIDWRAD